MDRTANNSTKATFIGIAAWLIFLAATGLYFLSSHYLRLDQPGYYFILAVVFLIFLVLVLVWIGRRRSLESKATLALTGALIWAGLLVLVFFHLNNKRVEATKKEIRELAQTSRSAIQAEKAIAEGRIPRSPDDLQQEKQTTTPPENLRSPTAPASSVPEALRKINEMAKELSQRSITNQTRIASELKTLGLETMFLPETLTSLVGIEQNRKKIRDYRELADRSITQARASVTEAEQRLRGIVAGLPHEAEFLSGFAKAKQTRADLLNQMHANHVAAITAITDLNEFMASRLGRVRIEQGRILFQTQEDVDRYNSYLAEIKKRVKIESDLEKRYLDLLQKALMDMDKMEEQAR